MNITLTDDILLNVKKPAQYIGNEWNVIKKDFDSQKVRFAVCFPDLYEIGMSHLGLRIIYGLLNEKSGVVCERVFLPDVDMICALRNNRIPIFSLESKRPLADFDFIGFCLNYELSYTNILAILDLAGIPLKAQERSGDFPLIIAGGCSASNPEPLSDFIDMFLIGEAEEALPEIINVYNDSRDKKTKEEILKNLSRIKGVYVPSLYDVQYNQDGQIKSFTSKYTDVPGKINKRIIDDLNQAYYPTNWLVPYCSIVHDRAPIEIMRGCPHDCNFCQAKKFYNSLRLRSPEKVLELAREICKTSGYEEISFLSLSTGDYPHLAQVVNSLKEEFCKRSIAVSLPSLRAKSYLGGVAMDVSCVRKTTFTFAPEAGSDRLRLRINKNFDSDEFYSAIDKIYKAGWQSIKLYFMIGLPEETSEDLDGILEVAKKVSNLRIASSKYPGCVSLSISPFIPKPHTRFEREEMESLEVLRQKKSYLAKNASKISRFVTLNFHKLETSYLEAIFSRGDRRLGEVLLLAYKNGCLLDGWPEHFKFDVWLDAFKESNLRGEFYTRRRARDEMLPWQHIVI